MINTVYIGRSIDGLILYESTDENEDKLLVVKQQSVRLLGKLPKDINQCTVKLSVAEYKFQSSYYPAIL
jgi:hypothetical protein